MNIVCCYVILCRKNKNVNTMIEKPPQISQLQNYQAVISRSEGLADDFIAIIDKVYEGYEYWDKYSIRFGLTNKMQRMCHDFDMNFGGLWGADSVIPEESKEYCLVSSFDGGGHLFQHDRRGCYNEEGCKGYAS